MAQRSRDLRDPRRRRIRFNRGGPRSARGRWQDRTTPRSVPQREGRALSIAETMRRLRARGYVRALEPAGSTPADFAFVGCGDPLMLLLPFKAVIFGRAGKPPTAARTFSQGP